MVWIKEIFASLLSHIYLPITNLNEKRNIRHKSTFLSAAKNEKERLKMEKREINGFDKFKKLI